MNVRRTFGETQKSVLCARRIPMSSKFHLPKWKTYFSQCIDTFLKIEKVEYLIHRVKFKIWPALFYVNSLFSQNFGILVSDCTSFPTIYAEIEEWDFEYCSKLDFPFFFQLVKQIKNWNFLDLVLSGKRQFSWSI